MNTDCAIDESPQPVTVKLYVDEDDSTLFFSSHKKSNNFSTIDHDNDTRLLIDDYFYQSHAYLL